MIPKSFGPVDVGQFVGKHFEVNVETSGEGLTFTAIIFCCTSLESDCGFDVILILRNVSNVDIVKNVAR
jgi:hypothetical protein